MNFTGFDKKEKRHSDQVTLLGNPPKQEMKDFNDTFPGSGKKT